MDKILVIAFVFLMIGFMFAGLPNAASAYDEPIAEIDEELLNLIDQYAEDYYNDTWNLTLNQYKAWITTIAWAEGGYGGYTAHSQYGSEIKSLNGDRFDHVNKSAAKLKFRFSTGIGPFQMDCLSYKGVNWAKEPTIRKLNSSLALLSALEWHYNITFNKGDETLEDFSKKSKWNAVLPESDPGVAFRWKEVTGENWEDHKDGKADHDLDWQSIKQSIAKNDPKNDLIKNIGERKWNVTFTIDNKDSGGNKIKVSFNSYYPTWLITYRGWSKTTLFQYYYTYNESTGCEVWVLDNEGKDNEFRYIFARNYTTGRFPENRTYAGGYWIYDKEGNPIRYIACAGELVDKPALNPYDKPEIFNLNILSPSSFSPAIVGDPSNPTEFNAKVSTNVPCLPLILPNALSAKIGNKPANGANIPSFLDNLIGIYLLQITPPVQNAEGSYDLNICFYDKDYDVESNAVIYSSGGNIDVVEVIDRSGSMYGEPIQAAKNSAKLFVDLMAIDDSIGVASYSSSASVNYGLTKISSETIKQNAKNAIDGISADGMTSIGAGLRAAYNELVNKGDPSHPHSIILMSDGWQNTAPHPDTVLPDIRNANIRVFTIGLGEYADADLLSHIAHDSGGGGGEYYYSPGSEELSAIYNAIAGVVKAESTVKTVTGSVQQGETIFHKVDIDPTINIATFTATWTSGTLNLGLERPDGSNVNPSDPGVSHTKEATYETYTIDNPLVGEWIMEITAPITSSSTTTISNLKNAEDSVIANKANNAINDNWSTEINVAFKMESAQEVLAQAGISYTATVTATTNLTVHMYTDKEKYSLAEPIKIIATLTKAGSPVTEADVDATIERPDTAKDNLSLYDDGKHDDGIALDGVYANYYATTDVSGSYTITVNVSGTVSPEEFTREVKKSVYVSGEPAFEILVTPASWDAGMIVLSPDGDTTSPFTISSNSLNDETVTISATDLMDAYGNVIESKNVISMPRTFIVPAGGSVVVYERIYVPETAKPGNYTGSMVLMSTANSVNIPVSLEVTIGDTTPPEISVTVSPDTLWSPNHKYVDVTATVTVSDICDPSPTVTLVSVTSNEPDDAEGGGDGNTVDDIVIVDDYHFKLRAERAGEGDGRVYTITYTATDASGNSASASATVVVPHDVE